VLSKSGIQINNRFDLNGNMGYGFLIIEEERKNNSVSPPSAFNAVTFTNQYRVIRNFKDIIDITVHKA
jgi:hypothetical protein